MKEIGLLKMYKKQNFPYHNNWLETEIHVHRNHYGLNFHKNPWADWIIKPNISNDVLNRSEYDLWKALLRAVDTFYENTDLPVYLMMSGGIDCELIARALIEKEKDWTPLIIRFKNGKNEFDIEHAIDFCKERNIDYRIHEYDIDHVYDNYLDYARKYDLTLGESLLMYYIVRDDLGSDVSVIRGEAEPMFERYIDFQTKERKWMITFSNLGVIHARDFTQNRRYKDAVNFYMYTDDLYISYAKDKHVQERLEIEGLNSILNNKHKILDQKGIHTKVRKKYTGFEQIDLSVKNKKLFKETWNGNVDLCHKKPIAIPYENVLANDWYRKKEYDGYREICMDDFELNDVEKNSLTRGEAYFGNPFYKAFIGENGTVFYKGCL